MKKLLLTTLLASIPLAASATDFTFTYSNTTGQNALTDMTHGRAYTWGLDGTNTYGSTANYSGANGLRAEIQGGTKVITSASLRINNIWDWANETTDPADAFYVNILGGLSKGTAHEQFDPDTNQTSPSFSVAQNPFVTGNSFNTVLDATALNFNSVSNAENLGGSLLKYTGSVMPNGVVINYTKSNTPADVTWSDPYGGSSGYTRYLQNAPTSVGGNISASGSNTLYEQYSANGNAFDLVINFTDANELFLQNLIKADNLLDALTVGLGFGPECHYNIDGSIVLSVTTGNAPPPPPSVPDGGSTVVMMGLALAGAAGLRRFVSKRA